ncbi:MAG: glycosyltransferase family 4 protein [Moorea sp. SIO2I5]|nr:glycosyltransferase family 4 protein [Moorena sp. SIO2I5]
MNIGIISTTGNLYSWAGSEETWRILATYAQQQGHQLRLLLPEKVAQAQQTIALKREGAKIYVRSELNGITRRLAEGGLYSRFKAFMSLPHDVIFVSTGGIADCAWMPDLKRILVHTKIPLVYFIQSNAEGAISGEHIRQTSRSLFEHAAQMIFLSQHNQSLAERQLAWKFDNTHIVMNPLREPVEAPLPWRLDHNTPLRFAEVARLEVADKQQDHLLEALSSPEWKTRNWTLTFFGSGADEGHIRRLIQFYGLEDKVKIGGFVRDFREIWQEHHLHILPSRREGMPLALIESMACGRPALVTRAGGSPELVDNNINGFICPGMHPEVLRETLERAWAMRNQWQTMGKAAAAKVQTVVPTDWASQILSILENAAKK